MTHKLSVVVLALLMLAPAPVDGQWWRWGRPRNPVTPTEEGGQGGGGDTITAESCSRDHVNTAIGTAVDGNTVVIPPCAATSWTSGIDVIGKAITITGSGGGKVEGSSISSVAIGTGSKSFTLRTTSTIIGFTAGDVVWARVKYVPSYMVGTVTEWNSVTGVLVLNITSVSGSGTHTMWTFQTPGTTQITHNASTSQLFNLHESSAGNVNFSGIQFIRGTGTGQYIKTHEGASGQPIIVHDIMLEATSGGGRTIDVAVNRGLFYHIFMHASWDWDANSNNGDAAAGPRVILPLSNTASWGSASTMGAADTTGLNNVYFEDSYFVGLITEAFDISEAARAVIRNNIFDHSGFGTHSTDTGLIGIRHLDVVDNTLIFDASEGNDGDGDSRTPGMDYFFFVRGGTYVFTGNVLDDIWSTDWGNKTEIKMVVENLARASGPYECYDSNNDHADQADFGGSAGYPLPRQVGQGRVTGANGNDTFSPFAYKGDLEPAYIWNNIGTFSVAAEDYADNGQCDAFGTPRPSVNDYIQSGRDYYPSTVKPGYTKYTYPHPLRVAAYGPQGTIACLGGAVAIAAGANIQTAITANSDGTAFCLGAGTHTLTSALTPKNGNTFTGEGGAIISGARLLTGWTVSGATWYVTGQTQAGTIHGGCVAASPRCDRPEDLYMDNVLKAHVATLGEVGAGEWFFDYAADRIYVGDDPAAKTVETTLATHAFGGSASNVTIAQLIIEKFAAPAQTGAIGGETTAGWTITNSELRFNHGYGIRLGPTMTVLNSWVHHNGQVGMAGIGDDILVEGTDISYNNTTGFDPGWEAGGTKFVLTNRLIVRRNFVHHNVGPGLWTDIDNINTLYEDNLVEDNTQMGIFHEISYAAIIRYNTVRRNATGAVDWWLYGGGIFVSASKDVEVYRNTVENNYNGITAVMQARGSGIYGLHETANLHVHDNTVTQTTIYAAGLGEDIGDTSYCTGKNNRWVNNDYFLGSVGAHPAPFAWCTGARTPAQWQSPDGQDLTGTFTRP